MPNLESPQSRGMYPMLSLTGTKHLHRIFDSHFAVEQQKFVRDERRGQTSGGSQTAGRPRSTLHGFAALQSAVAMEDARYLSTSGGAELLSHLAVTYAPRGDDKENGPSDQGYAEKLYSLTMMHLFNEKLLRRSQDRGRVVFVATSPTTDASGAALQRDWHRLKRELLSSSSRLGGLIDGGAGGEWFGQQLANPATGRLHYVIRNRWPPGTSPAAGSSGELFENVPPQFMPFLPESGVDGPIGSLQPAIASASHEDMASLTQLFLADDTNELQFLLSSNDDKMRRLSELVASLPSVVVTELAADINACEREIRLRSQLIGLLTILFRRFMVPSTTQHWSQLLNSFLLSNHDPTVEAGMVLGLDDVRFLLGFILERVAQSQLDGSRTIEHQEELLEAARDLQTLFPSVLPPTPFAPTLVRRGGAKLPADTSVLDTQRLIQQAPTPSERHRELADGVRRMITKNAPQLEVLPPKMQLRKVAEFVKGRAIEDRTQEVRFGLLNSCRVLLRSILDLYTPATKNGGEAPKVLHWSQRSLLLYGCYQTMRSAYYSWPTVAHLHRFSVTLEQIPNANLTTASDVADRNPLAIPPRDAIDAKGIKERIAHFTECLIQASGYPSDASSPPGSAPTRPSPSQKPASEVGAPSLCAPVSAHFRYVPKTDFTTVEALTSWGVVTGAVDPPQLSPQNIQSLFGKGDQGPLHSYAGFVDEVEKWVARQHAADAERQETGATFAAVGISQPAVVSEPMVVAKGGSQKKNMPGGKGAVASPPPTSNEAVQEAAAALRMAGLERAFQTQSPASQSIPSKGVCDPFGVVSEGSNERALLTLLETLLLGVVEGNPSVAEAPLSTPVVAAPSSPQGTSKRPKAEAAKESTAAHTNESAAAGGNFSPRQGALAPSGLLAVAPGSPLRLRLWSPLVASLTAVNEVITHPSFNPATQAARLGDVPPPMYGVVAPLLQAGVPLSAPILPPRRRHVLSSRLQGGSEAGLSSKTGYWLSCELLGHSGHFTLNNAGVGGRPSSVSLVRVADSTDVHIVSAPPLPGGCPSLEALGEIAGCGATLVGSRVDSCASVAQLIAVAAEVDVTLAASLISSLDGVPEITPLALGSIQWMALFASHNAPPMPSDPQSQFALLNGKLIGLCERWEAVACPASSLLPLFASSLVQSQGSTPRDTPHLSDVEEAAAPAIGIAELSVDALLAAVNPQVRRQLAALLTPLAVHHQQLIQSAVLLLVGASSEPSHSPSSPSSPTVQTQPRMPTSIPTSAPAMTDTTPPSPEVQLQAGMAAKAATIQTRLMLALLKALSPRTLTNREVVAQAITQSVRSHVRSARSALTSLKAAEDVKQQTRHVQATVSHVNTILLTLLIYWRCAAIEVLSGGSRGISRSYALNLY